MLLQKIDRYLCLHMVRLGVFYTLIPTIIIWIVQSRKLFELAMGSSASIWVVLKLSFYLVPSIIPHILPFAVLLAAIALLVRFYNDSELVIFWTAALSPARLLRSFFIVGGGSVILILLINMFLAPQFSRQLKIEIFNVKNDIIRSIFKAGVIQKPNRDVSLYMDQIRGNSYIKGFYLEQKTQDNQIQIFTAQEALLTEDQDNFNLLLIKGRIVNWPLDVQQENKQFPSILEFDKFTLNISDIIANFNDTDNLRLKARDYTILELLSAKNAKNSKETRRFIARGHEQILISLYPLVFILCAVLFMLYPMAPRGFPYMLILKTILCAVIFRLSASFIHSLAEDNLDYIYLSYLLPLIVIIASIMYIYYTRQVKL